MFSKNGCGPQLKIKLINVICLLWRYSQPFFRCNYIKYLVSVKCLESIKEVSLPLSHMKSYLVSVFFWQSDIRKYPLSHSKLINIQLTFQFDCLDAYILCVTHFLVGIKIVSSYSVPYIDVKVARNFKLSIIERP